MSTKVAFVVSIGRMSVGNETALPKIQSIVGQYGGTVAGGVGSSADPIIGVFGDAAQAAKAAQQAWYLDDVEAAKVLGTDAPGTIETPAGAVDGAAPDRGPSQYPKDFGLKEAIAAIKGGKTVSEAVDALLAASVVEKKEKKEKGEKEGGKEGKGDKDKDDADDKKKKMEEAAIDEAKNRWGHSLKKGMKVKVAHPRGGVEDDEIDGFEKHDDFSKAYGKQVRLKSGKTASADDIVPA